MYLEPVWVEIDFSFHDSGIEITGTANVEFNRFYVRADCSFPDGERMTIDAKRNCTPLEWYWWDKTMYSKYTPLIGKQVEKIINNKLNL